LGESLSYDEGGAYVDKAIYGPTLLAGYDLLIWKNIGLNFDLGTGYDINGLGIVPMMNIGFIFRIKQ